MDQNEICWVWRGHSGDFASEPITQPDWLQKALALQQWRYPAAACSTALELALSELAGEELRDGLFPWAEWGATQAGLVGQHWARLSLCHWQVAQGQMILWQPQWPSAAALDQLWIELADFIASDGLTLWRDGPAAAWVHGPALQDVPTAAWDKVLGRPLDSYLPQSDRLRRLQCELQMWFDSHSVNQGLEQPINSVWFSGTGPLRPGLAQLLGQIHWLDQAAPAPHRSLVLWHTADAASLWHTDKAPWWQRGWRLWHPVQCQ